MFSWSCLQRFSLQSNCGYPGLLDLEGQQSWTAVPAGYWRSWEVRIRIFLASLFLSSKVYFLKKKRFISSYFWSAFFQEQVSSDAKENLDMIERLYLQFTFNTLPSEVRGAEESVKASSVDSQFATVPTLRNKLEQSLLCVADNLLNCYSPDVSCMLLALFTHASNVRPPITQTGVYCYVLSTVSVHPSRVSGALLRSADWSSCSLCVYWGPDWRGGLSLSAPHQGKGAHSHSFEA